jgi:hypothetical protein
MMNDEFLQSIFTDLPACKDNQIISIMNDEFYNELIINAIGIYQ